MRRIPQATAGFARGRGPRARKYREASRSWKRQGNSLHDSFPVDALMLAQCHPFQISGFQNIIDLCCFKLLSFSFLLQWQQGTNTIAVYNSWGEKNLNFYYKIFLKNTSLN